MSIGLLLFLLLPYCLVSEVHSFGNFIANRQGSKKNNTNQVKPSSQEPTCSTPVLHMFVPMNPILSTLPPPPPASTLNRLPRQPARPVLRPNPSHHFEQHHAKLEKIKELLENITTEEESFELGEPDEISSLLEKIINRDLGHNKPRVSGDKIAVVLHNILNKKPQASVHKKRISTGKEFEDKEKRKEWTKKPMEFSKHGRRDAKKDKMSLENSAAISVDVDAMEDDKPIVKTVNIPIKVMFAQKRHPATHTTNTNPTMSPIIIAPQPPKYLQLVELDQNPAKLSLHDLQHLLQLKQPSSPFNQPSTLTLKPSTTGTRPTRFSAVIATFNQGKNSRSVPTPRPDYAYLPVTQIAAAASKMETLVREAEKLFRHIKDREISLELARATEPSTTWDIPDIEADADDLVRKYEFSRKEFMDEGKKRNKKKKKKKMKKQRVSRDNTVELAKIARLECLSDIERKLATLEEKIIKV